MTVLLLAWLHLLAFAVGLAGVWSRARALRDSLRNPEDPRAIRRALVGSAWWALGIVVLVGGGLWQLAGDGGRGDAFYLTSLAFLVKAALLLVVLALEIWPVRTLIGWRSRTSAPDPRDAGRIEVISYVQCTLLAGIALASTIMARDVASTAAPGVAVADSIPTTSVPATRAESAKAAADAPEPLEPSGTETITADDLALLVRQIAMPLDGIDPSTLRSNFDERRGGGARRHEALDIMAPRGTPIRSAARGRVLKLFTSANGGLMVYAADSTERFIFLYAHLDAYAAGLRDGAPLARGQLVGYVGSTGNASPTAPHLHFAVARSADVKRWSRGKPIDPLPVLVGGAAGR